MPGVLLMWVIVGQWPIVLPVGAGGGVTIFSLPPNISHFIFTLCGRRLEKD